MPFTGFWDRWRRRRLQQRLGSTLSLRETEKLREAARLSGQVLPGTNEGSAQPLPMADDYEALEDKFPLRPARGTVIAVIIGTFMWLIILVLGLIMPSEQSMI